MSDVKNEKLESDYEDNKDSSPSEAVSQDPKPEQTDNSERPEDGEQDVSQDPNKDA